MPETKLVCATKEDGTKIILNSDGTWKNIKSNSVAMKENEKFHFRKTCWGWKKDQVLNSEDKKPEDIDNNLLIFIGSISGLECNIGYVFSFNKLVRTKYHIIENHSFLPQYIGDYETLKTLLTKKYGNYRDDNQYWHDDTFKDNYSDWGTAISAGHLTFITKWSNKETNIVLILTGDNYEIQFGIEYSSQKFAGLEEKEVEDSTLLDL